MPRTPDDEAPVFVYFCQGVDGGPIKIGVAKYPRVRLRELQVGSPVKLRMIAIAEGGKELEAILHASFAEWRLHGEWFDEHAPGLADTIQEAKEELWRRAETCNPTIPRPRRRPYPTQPSQKQADPTDTCDIVSLTVQTCAFDAPQVNPSDGWLRRGNRSALNELLASLPPEQDPLIEEMQRRIADDVDKMEEAS